MNCLALSLLVFFYIGSPACAEKPLDVKMPDTKKTLGKYIPNVQFFDPKGRDFFLKDFIANKPLIISLIYTRCPTTCLIITDSLKDVVSEVGGLGKDFNVLSLSFDYRDTPHDLGKFNKQWNLNGKFWKVASGNRKELKKFLEAVDFHYTFDSATGEFLHPNFLVILTPGGKISKYLYGVSPNANSLKMSILEAKKGSTSFTALDGFLLQCYAYDPATGTYKIDYSFILEIVMGSVTIITIFMVVWGKSIYSFLFRRKSMQEDREQMTEDRKQQEKYI